MTEVIVECTHCDNVLDIEEAESPERDEDGDVICDRCYEELYRDDCSRCGEIVDKTDLPAGPDNLIIMMEETDSDLPVGYYRVLRRPFFVDGMICGWFLKDALQRVADLDKQGQYAAENRYTAAGPMCRHCQAAICATQEPKDQQ